MCDLAIKKVNLFYDYHPKASIYKLILGPPTVVHLATVFLVSIINPSGPQAATMILLSLPVLLTTSLIMALTSGRPAESDNEGLSPASDSPAKGGGIVVGRRLISRSKSESGAGILWVRLA